MRLVLVSFFLLILQASTDANIIVRTIPEGRNAAVPAFEQDGAAWVSIMGFAERAGFRRSADTTIGSVTFTNERGRITFVRDNHFYFVDTAIAMLPLPPVTRGGALFLPAPDVVRIFGAKWPGTLNWNARTATITANTLRHTILSITSSVKQNGTLISIELADSLMYECTYIHPNLVVNFHGGSVAPNALRRSLRGGIVDSVFTLQYDGSAQISLMLNRPVEEPHIDYNRANRTLMISLRPRVEQQRPAAPAARSPVDMPLINTIVIDPGHGGRDPGAVGPTGVLEKNINLAISLELKRLLERAGIKVYMTRDKDVFVPLRDRTRFANDKRADLFVSIHANASERRTARGYKTYFLSQARNEADKLAAMRENAVIEFEDNDQRQYYDALQNVLISVLGTEYLRESQELSIIIEQTLGRTQRQIPRQQLGVGQANFWVLNGAYMPAVLIETGFISNAEEETLLSDRRVQFQIASAISEAIVKFKKQFETGQ